VSHEAPVITQWSVDTNGSVTVEWEVDTFFPNSEAPDDVWVEINSAFYRDLGRDGRSITIPASDFSTIPGNVIAIGVSFKWAGPPDDVKQSPVLLSRSDAGGGHGSQPTKPTLSVVTIEPLTLQHPNRITIAWSSYSYTNGSITWGPVEQPTLHNFTFKPQGANYQGKFTTDGSLASNKMYTFRVTVENKFQSHSESSVISIRSAANFRSVRTFLQASGKPAGSLRAAFGHGGSLRSTMGS
jgi:hypothetical protein